MYLERTKENMQCFLEISRPPRKNLKSLNTTYKENTKMEQHKAYNNSS
jgi:hypothetical protein